MHDATKSGVVGFPINVLAPGGIPIPATRRAVCGGSRFIARLCWSSSFPPAISAYGSRGAPWPTRRQCLFRCGSASSGALSSASGFRHRPLKAANRAPSPLGTMPSTARRSAPRVEVVGFHRHPQGRGAARLRFRPRKAKIPVGACKPAFNAGNFGEPRKPELTHCCRKGAGGIRKVVATAQKSGQRKELRRAERGSPDRDQALAFPKRGLLTRTERPLDTSRTGASKNLRRHCRQQRPALASPPIPDEPDASKTWRRWWSTKSVPPALPTGAARQASAPADQADRSRHQSSLVTQGRRRQCPLLGRRSNL